MTNPTPLEVQHKRSESAAHSAYSSHHHDDEFSLIDVWVTLWKYRKFVLAVIVLSILSGIAVAILKPKQYRYSAAVEIGTTLVNTGNGLETRLIDTPETALAKIQKSFIPAVIQAYATQHHAYPGEFKMDAFIPEKSELIDVTGKGTLKQASAYKKMISNVVAKLVADHEKIMQAVRAKYQARLAQATIKLEALTDPNTLKLEKLGVQQEIHAEQNKIDDINAKTKFVEEKLDRLENTDRILKTQILQIGGTLKSGLVAQRKALTSPRDEATALTTLMVSNEVLQSQRRLADLQERLQVTQPNLRKQIENQIASLEREKLTTQQKIVALQDKLTQVVNNNSRAIASQKQNVLEMKSRIEGMRETQALNKPLRSLLSVSLPRSVIVGMFGVAGVLLAGFLVYLREFKASIDAQPGELDVK